jgi:hypothetical protein
MRFRRWRLLGVSLTATFAFTVAATTAAAQTPEPEPVAPAAAAVPPPKPVAPVAPAARPPVAPAEVARPGDYLHNGFYLRFWAGGAYLQTVGTEQPGLPSYGGPGYANAVALGWTVGRLVIAATASIATAFVTLPASARPATGTTPTSWTLYGVLMDWFPSPTQGAHFGGALGLSQVDFVGERGLWAALSAHGGYDFWVTSNWSAGVLASVTATPAPSVSPKDASGGRSVSLFVPLAFTLCATILYH